MIHFNFSIRNPFTKQEFNILKSKFGEISKHKCWEFGLYKDSQSLVAVSFDISIKRCHSGMFISLSLFGNRLEFEIYDSRHWNHETGEWEVYEDE